MLQKKFEIIERQLLEREAESRSTMKSLLDTSNKFQSGKGAEYEWDLKNDMRELSLQFEREKMYLNNIIMQKNNEIKWFKDELDMMIDEMK